MDYQEAINALRIERGLEINGNPRRVAEFLEAIDISISAMQEIQEQKENMSQYDDYVKVQKWAKNIMEDAYVCLDKMEQEAKNNPNVHYSTLFYESRKQKAKTIMYALVELVTYKKLGTLEEVREAVEKQKAISREIIEGKYFCPKCHNLMPYPGYCGCGQKLY